MIPYFAVFGILVLLSIFEIIEADKKMRFWAAIAAVILILLFAGLRSPDTSDDGKSYISVFLEVPDVLTWLGGHFKYSYNILQMEPFYILLCSVIKLFTYNYIWLFLIMAAIAVLVNAYNYFKYSPYVILTLILYFSHPFLYKEMGSIRTGLASAILLFSIGFIYRKKLLQFSAVTAAASLFHFAAFPFFLSYFVNLFDFKKKTLYIILAIAFLIGLIGISSWMIQYLPPTGEISQKILAYYEAEQYSASLGVFDITNIKLLFFSILLIYFKDTLQSRYPFFKVMLYIYLTGTVWRIAFNDFGIFAARIATFFIIVEVILLPMLVTVIRTRFIAYLSLVIYAFIALYLNLYVKEALHPYGISINILQLLKM
ncbi:MAG: EpsG family protein [Sedimentisphaerales bacterium]